MVPGEASRKEKPPLAARARCSCVRLCERSFAVQSRMASTLSWRQGVSWWIVSTLSLSGSRGGAYLPTCPPIYLLTYLSAYLFTYLPTYLPAYLPAYIRTGEEGKGVGGGPGRSDPCRDPSR